MRIPQTILPAVVFGAVTEALALAISFGLYSLKHGREPMEPPYNWAATVLQMPGIFVSDFLARSAAACAGWFLWGVTYCVQAALWSIIGFAVLGWRARKAA